MMHPDHTTFPGALLDASGRNIAERGEAAIRKLMARCLNEVSWAEPAPRVDDRVMCVATEGGHAGLAADSF